MGRGGALRLASDAEGHPLTGRPSFFRQKRSQGSGLWSKLAALPWAEIKKLPARERLGVGYFEAARRRVESLKEGSSVGR
jgi:hypothetical protein